MSEIEAAPGSALEGMRARREKKRQAKFIDLRVPDTEPVVWVRYGAAKVARTEAIEKQFRDVPVEDDRTVRAEAAFLAESCIGVFEKVDGEPVSIHPDDRAGTWPRFGPELARILGLDATKAADIVLEVYDHDDDAIIATSQRIAVWRRSVANKLESDAGN